MELPTGYTLGAFRVIEKIGRGAMGTVYRARQPALERDVALKVLNATHEPEAFAHLHEEAIRVAQLRHPSILPVFDFGQQDDIAYIAMQLADGGTLAQRLDEPMTPAAAIQLLRPVAQAIDYAHEASIIHRDVKPANMLFDSGHIFLSDFGLALMRDASTTTGQMVGTPWYMAPEQFRGKAEPASDVYALAATVYQLLTGHLPFERDTALAVMLAHLKDNVPLARDWNPEIPAGVDRALRRGLAKEPERRFQRAMELLAAIHAVQKEQASVSRPAAVTSPPTPAPKAAPSPERIAAASVSRVVADAASAVRASASGSTSTMAASSMARTMVSATAVPKPAAPTHGRVMFESQPTFAWAKASVMLRDPRNDHVRTVGDLIQVTLSQRGAAHVMLPVGVLNDFMAELQFGVSTGTFELLFHEGASAQSHCVRLEPRGQISLGLVNASGQGGERWLAQRNVPLDPKLQHKLLIVANKGSMEAYVDGRGVAAANDKTLGWGMLRLQMLPTPSKPSSLLLLHHVGVYRLPD